VHDYLNTTIIDKRGYKKLQDFLGTAEILNRFVRLLVPQVSRYECVFVVVDFWFAGFVEDNRNDIEAIRAVVNIICCEEIAGGAEKPSFLRSSDRVFR